MSSLARSRLAMPCCGVARQAALVTGVLACLAHGGAWADEPVGCDAFKWPLKQEALLLQAANKPEVASGSTVKADGTAFVVKLVAFADAHLPQAPGRTPKYSPSNAGFVNVAPLPVAGTFQITLSDAVWVDVIQEGKSVKPTAFSGAKECPGVRKSLRFSLAAAPFVVEISGTGATAVGVVATSTQP